VSARRLPPLSIAGLAFGAVAVWWAFRPLPLRDWPGAEATVAEVGSAGRSARAPVGRLAALDMRPFSIPLWVAPAAPRPAPIAPPPAPPPPPFRVQLIAIVQEPAGGGSRQGQSATFYDPDTDRLLVFKEGDAISGRTIARISSNSVELREGSGTRTIALSDDAARNAGSGR